MSTLAVAAWICLAFLVLALILSRFDDRGDS